MSESSRLPDLGNPGSAEAREKGCICPVLDNNHGKWAPWPPDGWYVVEECPVHRPLPAPEGSNP